MCDQNVLGKQKTSELLTVTRVNEDDDEIWAPGIVLVEGSHSVSVKFLRVLFEQARALGIDGSASLDAARCLDPAKF